jgi:hypothetical protein
MVLQATQQPLAQSNQTLPWILAQRAGMNSPTATAVVIPQMQGSKKGSLGCEAGTW